MTDGHGRGAERPDEREDGPDARDAPARPSVLASTGSMAIATMVSRITGFFKILLTAAVLGPATVSAFTVSNQLPNIVEQLVLGAVLTAIVIPVLVRAEQEDADGGSAFMRRLFTMAMTIFGIAMIVAVAGAPWLSQLMIGSDAKVDLGLTTALAYLLLPQILFYGVSALLTAILNTRSVFKPGAWAPVVNNVIVIVTLVVYYLMPGEMSLNPVQMGQPKLLVLGIGTTLGVVFQGLVLIPYIHRQGLSLRPLWGIDPRLKKFAGMAVAIIVYVAISQVGMVITTRIAASVDEVGPAIYNFMWLLLQVPYGILGVTLLTAIMPQLSRNAAAGDNKAVIGDLTMSTKLTLLALVPIVMFFTFDGPGIGRALFNYGNFGAESSTRLGMTLAASAFTLIPYALVLLHLRVFYARERAWTPTFIIIGIMGVKTVLSLLSPVFFDDEHVVVALGAANGLGFLAGMFVGGWLLRRSLGPLGLRAIVSDAVRILAAATAGVVVMLLLDLVFNLHEFGEGRGGLASLLVLAVDAVVMLGVTGFVLTRMRVPIVDEVMGSLGRVILRLLPAAMVPARLRGPTAERGGADDPGAGQALGDERAAHTPGTYRPPDRSDRGTPGARPAGDPRILPPAGHDPAPGATRRAPLFSGPGQPLPDLMVPYPGFDTATYDPILPRVDAALRKWKVTDTHASAQRAGSGRPARGPRLIPGAMVAGGRYRLLVRHGGASGLQFWKALDTRLDRDVALTFIDAEGAGRSDSAPDADNILSRTLRLGKINSPGLARVLDVVRGASGGIVVSEWTEGSPLHEVSVAHPPANGAARAVAVLAGAAEESHRAGTELSIDHPDRIRITPDGAAVLAFPATLPESDQAADVHGLGACLYALLTGEWPTAEDESASEIGGFKTALLGPQGLPTEPHLVRSDIPFEISAVAMRAIQGNSGIRTAATVQHVLDQAADAPTPSQSPTSRMSGVIDRATRATGKAGGVAPKPDGASSRGVAGPEPQSRRPGASRGDDARYGSYGETPGRVVAPSEQSPTRSGRSRAPSLLLNNEHKAPSRKTMSMVLIGLIIAVIAVVIFVMLQVSDVFGGGSDAPLTQQNIGLNPTTTSEPAPESPQAPPPPASVPAAPATINVFSPQGVPDDPRGAALAIDGNPGTQWATDQYFQQLPALKNGVGLMAGFDRPVKVMTVGIDSPSPGTHVEIRTAPSPNAPIDQTRVIGTADLGEGHTEIPIDPEAEQASDNVLVWITKLGKNGSQFQSKITELSFTVAE